MGILERVYFFLSILRHTGNIIHNSILTVKYGVLVFKIVVKEKMIKRGGKQRDKKVCSLNYHQHT